MEAWKQGPTREFVVGGNVVTATVKSVRELYDAGQLPLDYYKLIMVARDGGTNWTLIEPKAVSRDLVSCFERGRPYDSWDVHIVVATDRLEPPDKQEEED